MEVSDRVIFHCKADCKCLASNSTLKEIWVHYINYMTVPKRKLLEIIIVYILEIGEKKGN